MKKSVSILVGVSMLLSGFTSIVNAEEVTKSVKASFSAQCYNAFLCAPQFDMEISSDTAENYGFSDSVNDGVSVLDVLVKAHEVIFGEDFTKDTAEDYMKSVYSEYYGSYSITKVFGTDTYSFGFAVNQKAPHNDVLVEDKIYGDYYIGYSIDNAKINNDDFVEFYIYQDDSVMDNYVWFEKNGEKVTELSLVSGEAIELNMQGYMIAWYGCSPENVIEEQTDCIPDAQLCLVDIETGTVTDIEDAVTDEYGNVTIKFNAAGDYLLSAYMSEDEVALGSYPIIMPLVSVNVKKDFEITINVKVNRSDDFVVLVVLYDDNDKLIKTEIYDISEFSYDLVKDNVNKVKVMLFNSIEGLMPYCENTEIRLK